MIPRLNERRPGLAPLPGAGNWYGTTLRLYDTKLDALAHPLERSGDRLLHAADRPAARQAAR